MQIIQVWPIAATCAFKLQIISNDYNMWVKRTKCKVSRWHEWVAGHQEHHVVFICLHVSQYHVLHPTSSF